jgi:hypothetical protein
MTENWFSYYHANLVIFAVVTVLRRPYVAGWKGACPAPAWKGLQWKHLAVERCP